MYSYRSYYTPYERKSVGVGGRWRMPKAPLLIERRKQKEMGRYFLVNRATVSTWLDTF